MKGPGKVALKILEVLKQNPAGADMAQIRAALGVEPGQQEHLNRRLRELDLGYIIERIRSGKSTVYRYAGDRPPGEWQYAVVSKDQAAEILGRAHERCQMCGKTIAEDHIKLHIDHKIPRTWGGQTVNENLWAICSGCNEGKKNYFQTFDAGLMTTVMAQKSVHRRIAEVLRLKSNEWVSCELIEFVANFNDWQTDWRRRLRELRDLGLEIEVRRVKRGEKNLSEYKLTNWVELPEDPRSAIHK